MNRILKTLLMLTLVLSCVPAAAAEKGTVTFSLKDENGKAITQDTYKGREYVLFIFTFECPHCRRAMPVIKDLFAEGKTVLGVVYSTRPADLAGKKKKAQVPFSTAIGTKKFQEDFNIRGVPTIFLVAADGAIKEKFSGSKGAKALREFLHKGK